MIVHRLGGKGSRILQQCQFPATELVEIGYKGYREQRVKLSGLNPAYCIRHAQWEVDGKVYCQQHAGKLVLEDRNQ